MSLLGMKGGTGIGTDPRFLGSIWTQIWTWLDSNPVFGFYGVEIFTGFEAGFESPRIRTLALVVFVS